MRSQQLFIVPFIASWLLLALLSPAEAGLVSWISNLWKSPTGNGKATPNSNTAFSPMGTCQHAKLGTWGTHVNNFGSVYQVTIQKQTQNGECVENVKIGLQGSKLEKTLKYKCSGTGIRRVRNDEDLLLIGSPDKNFCVFTTNKNEVYYLQDGKWKKGDFSDNIKDKELTPYEITAVKERIKKWQAFFEKSDKEIQRIRGLKRAERERFKGERARIRNERQKEKQSHSAINKEIYRLKAEERKKHTLEKNNIYRERAKEGGQWSAAIEQLQSAEDERHENRIAELGEMKEKEDKRFETALNDFENKVYAEESKSEKELSRLESLEAAEEIRALQEMKENIKQGW